MELLESKGEGRESQGSGDGEGTWTWCGHVGQWRSGAEGTWGHVGLGAGE